MGEFSSDATLLLTAGLDPLANSRRARLIDHSAGSQKIKILEQFGVASGLDAFSPQNDTLGYIYVTSFTTQRNPMTRVAAGARRARAHEPWPTSLPMSLKNKLVGQDFKKQAQEKVANVH